MGNVCTTYIEFYVFLEALFVCLKCWPGTSKTPKCKRPLGLWEQKSYEVILKTLTSIYFSYLLAPVIQAI